MSAKASNFALRGPEMTAPASPREEKRDELAAKFVQILLRRAQLQDPTTSPKPDSRVGLDGSVSTSSNEDLTLSNAGGSLGAGPRLRQQPERRGTAHRVVNPGL